MRDKSMFEEIHPFSYSWTRPVVVLSGGTSSFCIERCNSIETILEFTVISRVIYNPKLNTSSCMNYSIRLFAQNIF